jgi:HSP20 family protein
MEDKTPKANAQQGEGRSMQQQDQQLSQRPHKGDLARRADSSPPYFPSTTEFFNNPFGVMRRMHEDMDRMFAQALGGGLMNAGEGSSGAGGMSTWAPVIEVKQQADNLVVCAELPGLKPEEVQVEMNEGALVIQGERRNESKSEEGGFHRTERHYGRFYRAIPLPDGANAEEAKASFNNGVLEVTVPLPHQQTKRRQIPIGGGGSSKKG